MSLPLHKPVIDINEHKIDLHVYLFYYRLAISNRAAPF